MQKGVGIILIFIVLLLGIWKLAISENFTGSLSSTDKLIPSGFNPYNAREVNKNPIPSLYDKDTENLELEFSKINKEKGLPKDYTLTYKLQLFFYSSPFNNFFKKKIIDAINETEINGSIIIRDLYNVYWMVENNKRHYICTLDLYNKKMSFTRQLVVYIILNNANNYIDIPIIDNIYSDIDVRYIKVQVQNEEMMYGSIDNNTSYPILNRIFYFNPRYDPNAITQETIKLYELKMKSSGTTKSDGFCFNTTNVRAKTEEECQDSQGVWDVPPKDDMDCPYYKANKNYPNEFGGIRNNICTFPQNMQVIGYKNYSADLQYLPLCYNCDNKLIGKGSLGNCCEEQKDKLKYPNLLSPDYAYIGDTELRRSYNLQIN